MLRLLPMIVLFAGCSSPREEAGPTSTTTPLPTGSSPTPPTTTTTGSTTTPTRGTCDAPAPILAPTPTTAGPWLHDDSVTRFIGRGPVELAGYEAADVGDVNGDGHDDLLVASQLSGPSSSEGMAWIFFGPVDSGDVYLECADVVLEGEQLNDRLGMSATGAGDLTGDGVDDVALAANTETVFVFEGNVAGSFFASDAHARLLAPYGALLTGYGGITSGDLTGDGRPDLLIAMGQPQFLGKLAWIAAGPMAGETDLDGQIAFLDPTFAHAGDMGVAAGDWTGDGQSDALLALPYDASDARVYAGPIVADLDVDAWDARVVDAADSYMHHVTEAGDVDGDGTVDVLLCGAYYTAIAGGEGRCSVLYGPLVGEQMVASFPAITGEMAAGYLGESLTAGDFDGDGLSDVVVAQSERGVATRHGASFLFFGPLTGAYSSSDADHHWMGAYDQHDAARSVANVGDVDGDGIANLLVGASGDMGRLPGDAGAWYLIDPATF